MVEKARKQIIGRLIRQKRKELNIGQTELGLAIWGSRRLSDSALQTKVSRMEHGDHWPPKDDLIRVIDHLGLWDEIFDLLPQPNKDDPPGFYLDPAWARYVPNLETMISLLSDLARKGNTDLFYRQLSLLCDSAAQEYESKQKNKKSKNSFF